MIGGETSNAVIVLTAIISLFTLCVLGAGAFLHTLGAQQPAWAKLLMIAIVVGGGWFMDTPILLTVTAVLGFGLAWIYHCSQTAIERTTQ